MSAPIAGTVAPGFEPLADAFRANFEAAPDPMGGTDPGDLGASLCVQVAGRTVADLWGGWSDVSRTTAWQPDTLVNAYSVGKAATAVAALVQVDRGELDLDAPLAAVWPDMRGQGRELITLRQALCHQAGLPAVRDPLPDDAIVDWDRMCAALAATSPWWTPGDAHGYHTNTVGFLVGEPVCRTRGEGFSRCLAELVTERAEASDFFIGLPSTEHARCAEVEVFGPDVIELLPEVTDGDEQALLARNTYFNPPTMSGMGVVNTARWRAAMVPSTNAHATARSVATFYSALLPSAGPDGLVGESLMAEATSTQSDGHDLVLGRRSRFGLGFMLHQDERPIGVSPASFGHFGYGGSIGFADPDADVAFAYLISRPGDRWQMPRTRRLLGALTSILSTG